MPLTNFPNGVTSFGVPVLGGAAEVTTGNVYFVSSTHADASDNNDGETPDYPLATIDAAIGKTTANQGDVIYVMPGHAETITTAIAADVAGISIIGLGVGRTRPALTGSGAIDVLDVTAANVRIHNLRFVGVAADVTAQINVNATDCEVSHCVLEQNAIPLIAMTVVAAADRLHVHHTLFHGTADGPDVAIDFEGEVDDWTVEHCVFNYSPDGIDAACIRADAQVVPGGHVHACRFICVSAPFIDFDSSDTLSGDGLLSDIVASIGPTTTPADIDTAIDQGGYVNVNVHVSKAVADSGSRIPTATGA